jgi:hypothetical protein
MPCAAPTQAFWATSDALIDAYQRNGRQPRRGLFDYGRLENR